MKKRAKRSLALCHQVDDAKIAIVVRSELLITELSKVYGYDQHSIGLWLGNTPLIQNRHYLQIMDDDHREAMCNWRDSKKGSRTDGSHLSAMVFRALRKVCPELVPAAEKHAAGITRIGLNGMFESTQMPLEEKPSVQSRGGPSSGGGTRTDQAIARV